MSLLVLCILREGQWDWGIDQHLQGIVRVGIIYARVWLCTRVILYFRPHDPIFFSCPLLSNKTPHSVSPPGLSHTAIHSCKEHSAKRDICSVRECPNYSWPFNHSGFGLRGICGVSHKCVSATLVVAVSLRLPCMLYLQMIKSQHIIMQFWRLIVSWYNKLECSIYILLLLYF